MTVQQQARLQTQGERHSHRSEKISPRTMCSSRICPILRLFRHSFRLLVAGIDAGPDCTNKHGRRPRLDPVTSTALETALVEESTMALELHHQISPLNSGFRCPWSALLQRNDSLLASHRVSQTPVTNPEISEEGPYSDLFFLSFS